jgi:RNA polymerase sigma-70 factor (ECF subfamily)
MGNRAHARIAYVGAESEGDALVKKRLVAEAATGALDPRIGAATAGDREAAEQLLGELLPRVGNLVRYLIGRDSDVEDITQTALLEILRSLGGFRGESKLTTWSDRITSRATMAHLRKRRRETEQRRSAAVELVAIGNHDDSGVEFLTRRRAVKMLDVLPEEQRHVVVLHYVVGLSVPELAEQLAVPFETVRSRLRLGMKKLRENFTNSRGRP